MAAPALRTAPGGFFYSGAGPITAGAAASARGALFLVPVSAADAAAEAAAAAVAGVAAACGLACGFAG
jgi:hypothetical protein